MHIRELLQSVRTKIGQDGDILGAELILAFVLNKDRGYLLTHDDATIDPQTLDRFYDLFSRMIEGEPVAYLLGHKEFFGLDFFVDKRVLIPRPETEHLVEKVLQFVPNIASEPKILDVGTGSGCIAVSLAKNLKLARISGVDISNDALEVARINAKQNDVLDRVEFLQGDLLQAVNDRFDIIVANLPYIGQKRFAFVSKSACDYEPHVALFGGDDGLGLYRRFFEQLSQKPWRPALLIGEFGFLQRDELGALFKEFFQDVPIRFEQDYAHIDRMFVVEWPTIE